MTVSIEIRFPWGRVHATPWGRHTNEGAVEWPPSPRRILRALYAVWKTRHPGLDEDTVHSLLDRLTVPPEYGADEVRYGSTRHYLAADAHTAGNYDRNLALDGFISCRPDRGLIVSWDVDLDGAESEIFGQLVGSIGFLGRAESICDARLTDQSVAERSIRWRPLTSVDGEASDPTYLLAATAPLDVDALVATPSSVRSSKRLQPASVIAIPYASNATAGAAAARPSRRPLRVPTAVRYLLDGPALPHRYQSLAVAHVLRQAALKVGPDRSATLSGRGSDIGKRVDQHRHAHYLVFSSTGEMVDTAVLWAPEGLDPDHVRGLVSLEALWSDHLKEVPTVRAIVEGVGDVSVVAPELCAPSKVWRTSTPFVITRYPKDARGWEANVAEQVRAEVERRGLPAADVDVDQDPSWRRFRRHRPDGRSMRSARPARHVTIRFASPIGGPICLGSLAHFSLGLFVPVT